MKWRALALLLLAGTALPVSFADQPPGLEEFQVGGAHGYLRFLDVDADAEGDFTVVWDTEEPGALMRLYSSNGLPVSDVLPIDTCSDSTEQWAYPAVARIADGGSAVVWKCSDDIVARRFTRLGAPTGEAFIVNSLAGECWGPAVASAGDGTFVVAWQTRTGYLLSNLSARRFSNNGQPLTDDVEVAVAQSRSGVPALANTADGDFAVVWEAEGDATNEGRVVARFFSSAGEPHTDVVEVSPSVFGERNPTVIGDPGSSFVMVWTTASTRWRLTAQRFSAVGEAHSDAFEVTRRGGRVPTLGADAEDKLFFVWPDEGGHFGRHFSSGHEPVGGEFRINPLPIYSRAADVSGDLAGNYVVVYESEDAVHARRLPRDDRGGTIHFTPADTLPTVPAQYDFGVVEAETTALINGAIRTGGALGLTIAEYVTAPGTAHPGEDYRSSSGQLLFPEDHRGIVTFEVDVYEDDEIEGDESFIVRLATPEGGAALLAQHTATVGIFDDDFNPPALDPVPLGPETVVFSSPEPNPHHPDVAVSPSGEFVVVWDRSTTEQYHGVFAQLFDRGGQPQGEPFQVHSSGPQRQRHPSVAFDNTGSFLVAWENGLLFQGRRFTGDGEPMGDDIVLGATEDCDGFRRSCSVLAGTVGRGVDGRFPFAWGDYLYAHYYTETTIVAGAVGPDNEVIETEIATEILDRRPVVASDRAGSFAVAWPSTESVRGQRFDRTVQPLGELIEFSPAAYQATPGLAMADNGHFISSWNTYDGVVAQPFDRHGQQVTDPLGVSQFSLGAFDDPTIDADPAGNSVVVWSQRDQWGDLDQDGSGSGIFARRISATGEPLGGEFPVNVDTEGDQRWPAVAVGRDGRFMVAWESQQADRSWDIVARAFAPEACVAHPGSLCLDDGRFQVEVEWHDHRGESGPGQVASIAGEGHVELRSRDSAVVEFFDPDNWEVVLKVLDGRAINDHFWVYKGAATDVAYSVTVEDTSCGQVRIYENPLGTPARAVTDTEAFAGCADPLPPSCVDSGDSFCLGESDRFRINVTWVDHQGSSGQGRLATVPAGPAMSSDSGVFSFFGADNWEMLVKVLDGCPTNGSFWVIAAAASDLPYTLRVTDIATNRLRTYSRMPGEGASALIDIQAFATCGE